MNDGIDVNACLHQVSHFSRPHVSV